MIRSPIRPIAIPSASGAASTSATWKNRNPKRRMLMAFAIVAPAIPPSSEMPPFQIMSHCTGEENSETCAITYPTRAPTIAPINDQNTTELIASFEIPRRRASFPNSQAPTMNPMAMNSPCGEIAKVLPKRKRSMTGQPTAPMNARHRCERNSGAGSGPLRKAQEGRERGHTRATARPSKSPLRTSLG